MMKKLIINLLIGIFLFLILEFISFGIVVNQQSRYMPPNTTLKDEIAEAFKNYTKEVLTPKETIAISEELFRKPLPLKTNKKPILIFGCSFAYGQNLSDEETFSYKLSKMTNRIVYNEAAPGWGPQHMLYLIREGKFFKEIKKEPEYIIYVYMDDHVRRLLFYSGFDNYPQIYLRYKEKNGKLEEIDPRFKFLWKLNSVKLIQTMITNAKYNYSPNKYNNFLLFRSVVKESRAELSKHYPNAKFVIFGFDNYEKYYLEQQLLKDDGFIIVTTGDLVGNKPMDRKKYYLPDGHPSAKAWDLVVPALVKKLNL